jgi:glycerol-3-phosphate acyltransferase PlsY
MPFRIIGIGILFVQYIIFIRINGKNKLALGWNCMVLIESALAIVVGYLLGSISFTAILVKVFASEEQQEVIQHPSTQTDIEDSEPVYGAYSTNRIWGAKVGVSIAILDMAKVAIPMWIFKEIVFPGEYFFLLVSIAGVLGHNYPIYFRFKGGRGVSVIFGSFFVIDWLGPFAIPFLSATLGLIVVQRVGVAYFGSSFLMFPWLWFRTFNPILLLWALVVNLLMYLAIVPDYRAGKKIEEEQGEEAAKAASQALLPGTNGMNRAIEKIEALGAKRYALSFLGIILLVLVFWFLPAFPF